MARVIWSWHRGRQSRPRCAFQWSIAVSVDSQAALTRGSQAVLGNNTGIGREPARPCWSSHGEVICRTLKAQHPVSG